MISDSPKWMIICNPRAGSGKAKRDWPKIQAALREMHISFEQKFTEFHLHAVELAHNAYHQGFRHFVAIGGDGTLNEIVNGVARAGEGALAQSLFALVPVGKGNDWARSMCIPRKYSDAVALLVHGKKSEQERGCVQWINEKGRKEKRLFVNMFGAGFDAYVVQRIVTLFEEKKKLSALSYIFELLRSLFHYKSQEVLLELPDKTVHAELFTLAAGIGEYNGGGMRQCPGADRNDGLLDVTLVRKVSPLTVILNLPRLFNGNFVKRQEVTRYLASRLKIKGEELSFEADGELLGNKEAEIYVIGEKLYSLLP